MDILDFKTKVVIFGIIFALLTIIGLIVDNLRDNKHSPRYDQYGNAHQSNCCLPLVFFGSVIVIWVLSKL